MPRTLSPSSSARRLSLLIALAGLLVLPFLPDGFLTITPASALPTVTDPVVIDGYTQPGASANTLPDGDDAVLLVELSGTGIDTSHGVGASGLTISAGSSTVRGLVINRFSLGGGLSLTTAGNNVVEGNFLGTDAAGSAAAGNG